MLSSPRASWSGLGWEALKIFVGFLALSSTKACDEWSESTIPVTATPGNDVIYPLAKSNFTSTNPDNPAVFANIYFQAVGPNAHFIDMGCPSPLIASQNDSYLICKGSNITATEFSSATSLIQTQLINAQIGEFFEGFGTYQPQGNCSEKPFNVGNLVFLVSRDFNKKEDNSPALRG